MTGRGAGGTAPGPGASNRRKSLHSLHLAAQPFGRFTTPPCPWPLIGPPGRLPPPETRFPPSLPAVPPVPPRPGRSSPPRPRRSGPLLAARSGPGGPRNSASTRAWGSGRWPCRPTLRDTRRTTSLRSAAAPPTPWTRLELRAAYARKRTTGPRRGPSRSALEPLRDHAQLTGSPRDHRSSQLWIPLEREGGRSPGRSPASPQPQLRPRRRRPGRRPPPPRTPRYRVQPKHCLHYLLTPSLYYT